MKKISLKTCFDLRPLLNVLVSDIFPKKRTGAESLKSGIRFDPVNPLGERIL